VITPTVTSTLASSFDALAELHEELPHGAVGNIEEALRTGRISDR
jgi:hypothetical protein